MTNASLLINQGTNAAINFDSNGGTNTQVVGIGYGTVNTLGTLPNLPGGTINVVAAGTINSATAVLNNGTINVGTFVMPSGTLTVLPNLPQGSINVTAGTMIQTIGTINTGTINIATVTAGTINTGTINAGTFAMTAGTVTGGTVNIQGTQKDLYAAIGTFTITLGTLASSTAGVGRQSTLIDNTSNLNFGAIIAAQITVGSVTSANQLISLYLIRSDNGAPISDDAAGTGDAAWTQKNAPLIGNILVPTVGTAVQYMALFDTAPLGRLGPKWGIGVVQSTGNNLHTTLGSHSITYIGYNSKF